LQSFLNLFNLKNKKNFIEKFEIDQKLDECNAKICNLNKEEIEFLKDDLMEHNNNYININSDLYNNRSWDLPSIFECKKKIEDKFKSDQAYNNSINENSNNSELERENNKKKIKIRKLRKIKMLLTKKQIIKKYYFYKNKFENIKVYKHNNKFNSEESHSKNSKTKVSTFNNIVNNYPNKSNELASLENDFKFKSTDGISNKTPENFVNKNTLELNSNYLDFNSELYKDQKEIPLNTFNHKSNIFKDNNNNVFNRSGVLEPLNNNFYKYNYMIPNNNLNVQNYLMNNFNTMNSLNSNNLNFNNCYLNNANPLDINNNLIFGNNNLFSNNPQLQNFILVSRNYNPALIQLQQLNVPLSLNNDINQNSILYSMNYNNIMK